MYTTFVLYFALAMSMITIMNGIQWGIEFAKDKKPGNGGQIILIALTSFLWTIFYNLI